MEIHQFSNTHVIHAASDSMDPTIHPNDIFFVNLSQKKVVTGSLYVFVIR